MREKIWNKGMTLIEIAVVVSIVGIISVIAMPSIIAFMPRFKLNSQVSALQNDIMRARMKGISLNSLYRIRFYLNDFPTLDKYYGYFYSSGTWNLDEEMYEVEVNKNVDIACIADNSVEVTTGVYTMYFFSDGTCFFSSYDNPIGGIYLTNSQGLKKKMEIQRNTGFIKVFDTW